MPRYHFNVHDGSDQIDQDGSELRDLPAAKVAAVELAGALIKEQAAVFWQGEEWSMDVTDHTGLVLFQLMLIATVAPGGGPSLRSTA